VRKTIKNHPFGNGLYQYGDDWGMVYYYHHLINGNKKRILKWRYVNTKKNMEVLFNVQWEFQDPKMEVLYHIRPYFVAIFPEI